MSLADDGSTLYKQTIHAYVDSMAPGTFLNRQRQAKVYIKFAVVYRFDYLAPLVVHAAMYVKFLGNSFTSPASIKNYLAGAKSWIAHHLGDNSAFMAPEINAVFKFVTKTSNHVPSPAPPLLPAHVQMICAFIDNHVSVPNAIKPALLLGYTCFLRSSNLLSPNLSTWGGAHTLRVSDICKSHDGLFVIIRSSKTLSHPRPTVLQVLAIPGSPLCPVKAWFTYKSILKPPPSGPAFILESGAPLTALPVVKIIRLALKLQGVPNTSSFSMHSLRRGATQAADDKGASQSDLMSHGTWASSQGLKPYLKPQTAVPRLLASILAG